MTWLNYIISKTCHKNVAEKVRSGKRRCETFACIYGNWFRFGGGEAALPHPFNPSVHFLEDIGKLCRPRSDAPDQGLHCLLAGILFEIE